MLPRVVVFSRAGCHLCEEVVALIQRVASVRPLELEEIDIDRDPKLHEEYDTEVPVVEVNDREVSRYRLTETQLILALDRAATAPIQGK